MLIRFLKVFNSFNKKEKLFLISLILFLTRNTIYFFFYSIFCIEKDFVFKHQTKLFNKLLLNSSCSCRPQIRVEKELNKFNVFIDKNYSYSILAHSFTSIQLSCDLYNSINRGPGTKVISFSLYGKNSFYFKLLKNLVEQIKYKYPTWIMRIYHDDSIDKNLKCEMECLWNQRETSYLNIVDFCNIKQIADGIDKIDLSYMHAMSWRWLPIGDHFVDFWSSRDTDSQIFQREIDSVNVWLSSNNLFHVMRGKFKNLK